jgi:hypothetical protein
MAHKGMARNVPFDRIVPNGNPGYAYQGNSAYAGQTYGYPAHGQSRLPADDQNKFDRYYPEVGKPATQERPATTRIKNARRMQDMVARYSISANVSVDQTRPQLPTISLRTLVFFAANLHHRTQRDRARMF